MKMPGIRQIPFMNTPLRLLAFACLFITSLAFAEDPAALAKGTDPQLERGIKEILDQLAKNPPNHPAKPGYTDRTR